MYLKSFHCDHQIWRWGGGSLRNYYKPKQMKNLYDVETGVKKDVVGVDFPPAPEVRRFFPGAFSIWGSHEDCGKVLDWTCLYSGLVLIISSSLLSITNSSLPVWALHEPDLSYADPNYGGLARSRAWRQNQLLNGQCEIHQSRYFLSFQIFCTITLFLFQVLGSFGFFFCQLWASTIL